MDETAEIETMKNFSRAATTAADQLTELADAARRAYDLYRQRVLAWVQEQEQK